VVKLIKIGENAMRDLLDDGLSFVVIIKVLSSQPSDCDFVRLFAGEHGVKENGTLIKNIGESPIGELPRRSYELDVYKNKEALEGLSRWWHSNLGNNEAFPGEGVVIIAEDDGHREKISCDMSFFMVSAREEYESKRAEKNSAQIQIGSFA